MQPRPYISFDDVRGVPRRGPRARRGADRVWMQVAGVRILLDKHRPRGLQVRILPPPAAPVVPRAAAAAGDGRCVGPPRATALTASGVWRRISVPLCRHNHRNVCHRRRLVGHAGHFGGGGGGPFSPTAPRLPGPLPPPFSFLPDPRDDFPPPPPAPPVHPAPAQCPGPGGRVACRTNPMEFIAAVNTRATSARPRPRGRPTRATPAPPAAQRTPARPRTRRARAQHTARATRAPRQCAAARRPRRARRRPRRRNASIR